MKSSNHIKSNNQNYEKVSQNDEKNEIILFQQNNYKTSSVSA